MDCHIGSEHPFYFLVRILPSESKVTKTLWFASFPSLNICLLFQMPLYHSTSAILYSQRCYFTTLPLKAYYGDLRSVNACTCVCLCLFLSDSFTPAGTVARAMQFDT